MTTYKRPPGMEVYDAIQKDIKGTDLSWWCCLMCGMGETITPEEGHTGGSWSYRLEKHKLEVDRPMFEAMAASRSSQEPE